MAKQIGEEKAIEPTEPSTPRPADALIESGWSHYSKKEYFRAEEDFKKAHDIEPENADTIYALAMSQQASGRTQEAIATFEEVIRLLEERKVEEPVRSLMLTRLARRHINRMKTGDWKLEA
jgi:tetratricopeptide (TPR) repeat protein